VAGVLVASLFINQGLTSLKNETPANESRGIASVGSNLESESNRIKWEHEMAEQVARETRVMAHIAGKPSLRDELLFGMLAGRYGVDVVDGRISGLEWISTLGKGEPVVISDGEKFLIQFKNIWAVDFSKVRIASKQTQQEIYELIDSEGRTVGRAYLDFDPDGRFTSLKISK